MPPRRLFLSSLLLSPLALATDPWKKKYSTWKPADALQILNQSPWAQSAKVEIKIDGADVEGPRSGGVIGPPESTNGNLSAPGGGPSHAPLGIGGRVQHGPEAVAEFRALVRWDSARPVRLALGIESDPPNPHPYVLSLLGFPVLKADLPASLKVFNATTRLERPSKDWLRPSNVQIGPKSAVVFTFPADIDPITADDREVFFVTRLVSMNLRVKFNLHDMLYERQLAL